MKTLSWPQISPIVVAIQNGDVRALVAAARTHRAAADKLGLWELAMLLAHPTDKNRRRLWRLSRNWQGICLCQLMDEFTRQQHRADRKAHVRQCFRAAQRVAPDVLPA